MRRLTVAFTALALSLGSGATLAADEPEPTTGAFAPAGSLAEARVGHTATLLPDGRVLVVGGWDDDEPLASVEVWDPATDTFSPAGSLAEARSAHTATLLPDGRLLVVGGWGLGEGGPPLATAEVWDPATGEFARAGRLAEARLLHTATLLPDGRVLVVGGEDGDRRMLASAEVWDPATATFGPAGVLAEARGHHTATGSQRSTRAAKRRGSLAEAREEHTATLLPDGRVLVVGGLSDAFEALASAEVWDPATASFTPSGLLTEARQDPTATLLPDGRVLVVGGFGEEGDSTASAEVWDPTTGSFGQTGSLTEARGAHTSTLLPDGRVLVVGGAGIEGLASAEAWDPTTATFGPAGSLAEARYWHTTTLLPDGRVLVVGGRGDEDNLASAEVWAPGDESPPAEGSEASPAPEATAVLEATDRQPALADPALEAQFPDAVSGEPLSVEWRSSRAFVDGLPPGVAALADGLVAEQGITLDDVTVAMASSTQGSILGMRLAGGNAMAFFGPLLAGMFTGDPYARWTHIEVAGKDVMTIPFGSGSVFVRPQGEVVWGVSAEEPALTEILTALP